MARWSGRRQPGPGEVQVFGFRAGDEPEMVSTAWPLLSQTEKQRADRIVVAGARDEFVFGRAALRCLAGAVLRVEPTDLVLQVNAYGKPFVAGIHSNVTHSRGLIYVALCSDAPVGVDVEWIAPMLEALELAEANFLPEEARDIAAQTAGVNRARLFCALWTRKEAVAKAYGQGLRVPLQKIIVPRDIAGDAWIESDAELFLARRIGFHVQSLPAPDGYALAMAIQGGTAPYITRWNFHE